MNLSNFIKSTVALTVGASLIGCAPNASTTVPQVTSSFKMTGSGAPATVARTGKPLWLSALINSAYAMVPTSIVDSAGATITLSSAWTVIKEIEFESEEVGNIASENSEVEFAGPYFVDLLSNTPVRLDTQLISQKSFKRIKMKLHATSVALPVGAPAGLANNSIYLAGSISGKSFTIQLDDGTVVQIAGPNGFVPTENSDLLVEIKLANIFKQINMTSIVNNEVVDKNNRHAGANLCTSIDPSANDLYTCIRKGIEKHADFGSDRNGDSVIEANEDHVK